MVRQRIKSKRSTPLLPLTGGCLLLLMVCSPLTVVAQMSSIDSLRAEVLKLDQQVQTIELNIETSQKKFRSGILIATIGYSVTIAGGLMLGRENDELGQVLLVTGGATGIYGTYRMVDAFRFLSGNKKRSRSTPP